VKEQRAGCAPSPDARTNAMSNLIRALGLSLLCGLALVGPAVADNKGDILDDTKRKQDIERQRLEKEIQDLKREALAVASKRPDTAADLLKHAISKLESDTLLKTETRESLLRSLKLTLRDLSAIAKKDPPTGTLVGETRRADAEKKGNDDERMRRTMADIARLRANGQVIEASRLADDLYRSNPNATVAQIVRSMNSRADQLAMNKEYRDKKGAALLAVVREIEKSGIPIEGEIEFPRDWVERSQRRAKFTEQPMTKEEKAILKSLGSVVDVNLKDVGFQEFIEQMEKQMGVSIFVSKTAMEEASVAYTTPVSVRGKGASRTILRKVLSDLGLAYVVKDNTIQVTTIARAKEMLTTRSYYLGDLAGAVDLRWGPVVSQMIMAQNLAALVNTIYQSIEPMSWQVNGGPGTLYFNPATMTLIVRQTADVHYLLGNGIR
jgi:hypothetical protein